MQDGKELTINDEPLNELTSEKTLLNFIEQGSNIIALSEQVKHSREELVKIFVWRARIIISIIEEVGFILILVT